jgi:FtsZ-interacting cell division protein ZipA
MSDEALATIIVGVLTLVGVIITVVWGNKKNADVIEFRIGQLEAKVTKHNNLIERTYAIEKRLDVDEEKIKVANHRIEDLESELK